MASTLAKRMAAVVAAVILDRFTPEPPNRWHPVAWFGTAMTKLEEQLWLNDRARGLLYTGTGVTIGAAAGTLVGSPTAALTIALGTESLRRTATDIADLLLQDDLSAARSALPALVGRDPSELDSRSIAAAVVESVAENSVDATVAPIFWTLVAGAPGALTYRAINTMDAMVGHRSDRYARFGWGSAKLDDVANWLPARMFAAAVMAAAPRQRSSVLSAVRSDGPAHPSPNAGVAEAAVAGALSVELGGTLRYGRRIEHRPLLGAGPRPTATTIEQANNLVDRALLVSAATGMAILIVERAVRKDR